MKVIQKMQKLTYDSCFTHNIIIDTGKELTAETYLEISTIVKSLKIDSLQLYDVITSLHDNHGRPFLLGVKKRAHAHTIAHTTIVM